MKELFINKLSNMVDQEVSLGAYVKSMSIEGSSDNPFIVYTLQDRTGTVSSKVWKENIEPTHYELNEKFVVLQAKVTRYKSDIVLNISRITEMNPEKRVLEDYVDMDVDFNRFNQQLNDVINSIENEFLYSIVAQIFSDDSLRKSFFYGSAGSQIHHDYVGGLFVHTFSVLESCVSYATRNTLSHKHKVEMNLDLVKVGALLHDIGKIEELSAFPANKRTVQGKLLGHILLGLEILTRAYYSILASNEDIVDDRLYDELKHIIASSHGEEGSVSPMTTEAILVHKMDDLDSFIAGAEKMIVTESTRSDDTFTTYNKFLGNQFMKRQVS